MKKIFLVMLLIGILATGTFTQTVGGDFKLIDTWNHDDKEILTCVGDPIINDEGNVVARICGKVGSVIISKKEVVSFAPFGQGPSDLYLMMAQCRYQNDIAFLEYPNKMKIFTRKDNTYVWKSQMWLKQGYYPYIVRDMIFIDDKWFTGGYKILKEGSKVQNAALVNIFDEQGKLIKELLKKEFPTGIRHEEDYYLTHYNNRVFFMVEYELKVHEISATRMEVTQEIPLTIPPFYKKMPADFYNFVFYKEEKGLSLDYERWKTSYSYIMRVAVEDGCLVIQIRTFGENQKRFALLFYDINNFSLKRTISIDDYFLGTRNGIYYFYRNGNPGFDEDADECVVNLYSFKEKK
ncbi:MAG: hypothetical protein EHM45_22460 [Desulfobacteraceae bacterium]|nr:MAG: hypothetical protein EHM45_22460 [Desulfobacteraceae bacterium]